MLSPQFKHQFREEAPALLRLAAPLVAAQITFVAWGVIDTLMAGHMGARELAAIAVGANVWFQFFVFFMGLCIACSPIVAQRFGAGQAPRQIGGFVRQAALSGLALGLVWLALIHLTGRPLIDLLKLQPETADLAYRYLMAESWGAVSFALGFALRNCAEGLGLTRVVLRAGVAALCAKVGFNFWFVEWFGVVGFGWASAAAATMLLIAYLFQYAWLPRLRELEIYRREPVRLTAEVQEIFRLGLPIALILLAEVAFFNCTALLMARFGDSMIAAHQVAINFASLTFMVPMGIGMAIAVRVGHAAGAGLAGQAAIRGKVGMTLGMCFALFSATLMALLPGPIVGLYTQVPEVVANAVTFLQLAAIFQLFDCLQATANGALRGIKDTRLPMLITLSAYWLIGMPASYALAFHFGYGPNALWWGFTLGLGVAGIGLGSRFLSKSPRLILASS